MRAKILVIDDDYDVRQAFILALKGSDYELGLAESGEQGLALFQEHLYDLIFLDMKMPGISGVETLRAIRTLNAHIPIYIATAFHQEFFESLKTVAAEGLSFDLIKKPVRSTQILLILDSLFQ